LIVAALQLSWLFRHFIICESSYCFSVS